MSSSPVSADRAFAAWSGMRSAIALRTLSAESVSAYRSIWNGWCEFLAQRGQLWHCAASEDARVFLENLSPSRSTRSRASSVTQKRYFRVLKEIYACAIASGWVSLNPFDHEARVSPTEQHDSLVFNRRDWSALFHALAPASEIVPDDCAWQEVRDHSMLLMMMQAGLTVAELRELKLASVSSPRLLWQDGVPSLGLPFLPWEPQSLQHAELRIEGAREHQSRTMVLHAPNETMLMAWLSVRLHPRFASGPEAPLYISQKRTARLSPKSLFLVANAHICRSLASRHDTEQLAHAGPTTLRNSCIVRWLDAGMDDQEVLRRAGLKDAQALRRLRPHVVPVAPMEPPQ